MSELARIDVEELGTRRLIRINGEVDISNSRELATAIERAVSDGVEGVVIDLSGTTYLDYLQNKLSLEGEQILKPAPEGPRMPLAPKFHFTPRLLCFAHE